MHGLLNLWKWLRGEALGSGGLAKSNIPEGSGMLPGDDSKHELPLWNGLTPNRRGPRKGEGTSGEGIIYDGYIVSGMPGKLHEHNHHYGFHYGL